MGAHWTEQYVGMPYDKETNDCGMFAERVQLEIFGRVISLPKERATTLRGLSRQIRAHLDDFGIRTDSPIEGDGVLMIGRGRMDHIGIYCLINGTAWVLHAMRGANQVCLHRVRDLATHGLTVEGFYQWII